MKLYYATGACSLSPHIVLREAGVEFELERVDLRTHKTSSGADYSQINPKGYVPALRLDDGELLTEGPAIVQYLADQHPEKKLAPPNGTLQRARLQEHLNFISTELHKQFPALFNPASSDEAKKAAIEKINARLGFVEQQLSDGRAYLLGDKFSVADAYLFVVVNWTFPMKISLADYPHVAAFHQRVGQREKVREALRAEGLA